MISRYCLQLWMSHLNIKQANWPAPANIHAIYTTRLDGFSQSPYDANNLALHVGDNPSHVLQNRTELSARLKLTAPIQWLNQTHSTIAVDVNNETTRDADASISRIPACPLAILTADCLPIALCSTLGDEIAMVHAGWRGLLHGIVENTVKKLHTKPCNLMAWIGPAICKSCFTVGEEVYQNYQNNYPFAATAFTKKDDRWLADLPLIAELVLKKLGINAVHQSNICTVEENKFYYSYRKASQTGRIATVLWFTEST